MSRRLLSDKEALTPIACVVASLILLATTWTLMVGGWPTLAAIVSLVSLPIALLGLASTAWVMVRLLEAFAEIRRERAELERQGQDGGKTP
jgi:hypothetical protein